MKHNETPQTATLEDPGQLAAVAALLAGKSITDAAADAQVSRETVHRWIREDFIFQAELNRGRRELRRVAYGRLEQLAEKAAQCVENAIGTGDVKTSLEILKGMGFLACKSIGSDDPRQLADEAEEAEVRRTEREGNRALRKRLAGL